MKGTLRIANKNLNIQEKYLPEIQKLIDDIVILSKLSDKIKNILPIIDEHPSFLKIGYEINLIGLGKIKLIFSTHHDYNYEEIKYVQNNKIHCFTCDSPLIVSDSFFNIKNENIQYRGVGILKTTKCEAMIELLEEVKRLIVNL